MHIILLLALALWSSLPLSGQAAVQVCEDGRVLALTPFNRNPCRSAPASPPATPSPAPEPPAQTGGATPASAPTNNAVACEDGRLIQPTPFNPNPCRVAAPAVPARVPDEFLSLFGATPPALGLEIEDRVAEQVYRARYQRFVAQTTEPAGFSTVGASYFAAGLGDPGFYQDRSGVRVRWSEAPFYPADAALADALSAPEAVIAAWQAQAILRGGLVHDPSAALPPTVEALNRERLQMTEGAAARTPTVLVWGSSMAALALHEDGVELVGPAGGSRGALTRPAHPTEFVRLFLTGLDDPAALQVILGGVALGVEDYAFSSVANNRGGVWALVLRVPEIAPAGDLPVTIVADGVSSSAGPYLTVSR